MTNREQVAFALGFIGYSNEEAAKILCNMMDKVGIFICYGQLERLEKWLGRDCEEETSFFDWEDEDA